MHVPATTVKPPVFRRGLQRPRRSLTAYDHSGRRMIVVEPSRVSAIETKVVTWRH